MGLKGLVSRFVGVRVEVGEGDVVRLRGRVGGFEMR
jgi:hypothetical protein